MTLYFLATIIVLAALNILLRSAAFLAPRQWLQLEFVRYLSKLLPAAIMTILVFFCMQEHVTDVRAVSIFTLSGLIVLLMHLWKRNVLASIASGTLCYMLAIRLAGPIF